MTLLFQTLVLMVFLLIFFVNFTKAPRKYLLNFKTIFSIEGHFIDLPFNF